MRLGVKRLLLVTIQICYTWSYLDLGGADSACLWPFCYAGRRGRLEPW